MDEQRNLKDPELINSDKVFPVKIGIFNMWVCAPKHLTLEQVQEAVNDMPPSGTTAGWQVEEKTEADNPLTLSPGLCAESADRQHWNCCC